MSTVNITLKMRTCGYCVGNISYQKDSTVLAQCEWMRKGDEVEMIHQPPTIKKALFIISRHSKKKKKKEKKKKKSNAGWSIQTPCYGLFASSKSVQNKNIAWTKNTSRALSYSCKQNPHLHEQYQIHSRTQQASWHAKVHQVLCFEERWKKAFHETNLNKTEL